MMVILIMLLTNKLRLDKTTAGTTQINKGGMMGNHPGNKNMSRQKLKTQISVNWIEEL